MPPKKRAITKPIKGSESDSEEDIPSKKRAITKPIKGSESDSDDEISTICRGCNKKLTSFLYLKKHLDRSKKKLFRQIYQKRLPMYCTQRGWERQGQAKREKWTEERETCSVLPRQ